MKEIRTLIPDIYSLMERKDGWFTDELSKELSNSITSRLQEHYHPKARTPGLRLSKMGPRCPKALWHSVHTPEKAQPLPPWVMIKFSYGHILEAKAIFLAKAAGHNVVGEQDELTVDGVVGHRDCVIDGCIVDVKSSDSRNFIKFKDKSIGKDDRFGYLDQLDGYLLGSYNDPLVTVKDRGYLLAIDKQLGHMVLYEHTLREEKIRERIRYYKSIVSLNEPPQCTCGEVPHGESGNIALGVNASYNEFKFECFPHLRTFLYASGPVYLTKVTRLPDVPEIDRNGCIVVGRSLY